MPSLRKRRTRISNMSRERTCTTKENEQAMAIKRGNTFSTDLNRKMMRRCNHFASIKENIILVFLLYSSVSFCGTPYFTYEQVHVYSISEEVPVDSFIANLLIESDLAVKYSPNIQSKLNFVFLKEFQHLELFSLDERSGILRTGRIIDRDLICPSLLTCMLQLDIAVQPSAYFEVIKVEVTILDINDNGPTFNDPQFHLLITENTSPGERFALPSASDIDSLPNGVVEYQLLSLTSYFNLDINNDSMGLPREVWLILMKELDREQQDHCELIMIAYDGGIPRHSAILRIGVQVGDINDNSPIFEQSVYNVSISENMPIGATIIRLLANDADSSQNGHVRYRFSQRSEANYGDIFAIDTECGDVVLLQSLSHVLSNVYSLGVIAEDQGEFSSPALAALIVTITDVNDHGPQVKIDALSTSRGLEVNENADVGTFVAHISASDRDGGENGFVRCSINNISFRLIQITDGEYKLVTANIFDRETVSRYEVVISCYDFGEPRMYVNKAIIVNVADVNDNRPVFTYPVYNATLQENLPWGNFIVRISANDVDEGSNAEITYLLDSDADQRFHIDPDSGIITTLTGLDREVTDLVEFHVLGANKGDHGMVSRALIRIHVTDIDDESPKFLSSWYVFNVYENQPSQTEVGQVMAIDHDLPPFNSFSFVLHNSKTFGIDLKSGIIFTKRPIDREVQDQYELTVEALSNTVVIKHDAVNVVVNVLDVNDNTPNITYPNDFNHNVLVSSKLKVPEIISTIECHDLDTGVNADLSFQIIEGNGADYFNMDTKKGNIRLLKELYLCGNQTFLLVIKVSDGGTPVLFSMGLLHITVVDDNKPIPTGLPGVQAQWLWTSDTRFAVVGGLTAVCFVLFVFGAAVLLVWRSKSSQFQVQSQSAIVKNELMEINETNGNEDDIESLDQMKTMMKMVRMKDISYTELNSDIPCNVNHLLETSRGITNRQGVKFEIHQHVAVESSAISDPETDIICADVSHGKKDHIIGSNSYSEKTNMGNQLTTFFHCSLL